MPYPRLLRLPRSSFFLFGPRGTGKSTWLREHLPNAKRFDLLDEEEHQRYLREPGAFGRALARLPPASWVVVDEIQRLPALLNEVHRAMEERRLRFALCGSSARKLRKAGTNLLAGRALERHMHCFVPAELGDDYDIESALRIGTLPVVVSAEEPKETIAAYTRLYLSQEIQAEALVRNLAGFARFLPIAALAHGQVINLSNVARDAGVARMTVEGYLSVLEDTLLAFRLPAFESRLRVRERRNPKFYFVDPGIARSARLESGSVPADQRGHLFEGLVASMLRAHNDYADRDLALSYWAPADAQQTEVDFVVSRGEKHLAIEVKSASRVTGKALAGLRAIAPLPGLRRRIAVFLGRTSEVTDDGIDVLTFSDFAAELAAGALWP